MTKTMRFILSTILILAVIGVVTNILGFLQNIIFLAGIGVIIYIVYRLILSKRYQIPLFRKKRSGPTRAQLKKAQRTSTVKRLKTKQQKPINQTHKPPKRTRRDQPQLTVIDGKKSSKSKKKKA